MAQSFTLHFLITISFLALTLQQNIFTKKITDNQGCRACIDKGWTYYCTNSTRVPDSQLVPSTGYCCENYLLLDSMTFCNRQKMTCSDEVQATNVSSFKYALCPQENDVCGPKRDIIVYDYVKGFKTGYLDPTVSCSWRFIASSITQRYVNPDTQKTLYRVLKIRIAGRDKVKINAVVVENPSQIRDNIGLFENKDALGQEWNMALRNGGLTIVNITNQVYVVAVPEDYGGYINFEYFVDYVEDPSITFSQNNLDQQTDPIVAAEEEEDPYFNNYTRKVLSFALCSIFGLVFVYGIFRIWKVFFSREAKMLAEITAEIKAQKQKELNIKQRRKREEKWFTYQDDGELEGRAVGGWLTKDGTSITALMANKEASYKQAFHEIGNKKKEIQEKERLDAIQREQQKIDERAIDDQDIEKLSSMTIVTDVSMGTQLFNQSKNMQSQKNFEEQKNEDIEIGEQDQQQKSKKKKKRRVRPGVIEEKHAKVIDAKRKAKFYEE